MSCQIHNVSVGACSQCMANVQASYGLQAQNMIQYQNQYGLGGAGTPVHTLRLHEYEEYQMFKKYAHLSAQEKIDTFLAERGEFKITFEQQIRDLKSTHEADLNKHSDAFWTWCEKYCKELTKEKFGKYLKAFI